MEKSLRKFDETTRKLRMLYAERIRRTELYESLRTELDDRWLAWFETKVGEEPISADDDDVCQLLQSAVRVAQQELEQEAERSLMLERNQSHCNTMKYAQEALRFWQARVLDRLLPAFKTLLMAPIRAQFSPAMPELILMLVFGNVSPDTMTAIGAALNEINGGTLQFSAYIVDNAKDLLALCDSQSFADAFKAGGDRRIADATHVAALTRYRRFDDVEINDA